MNRRDFLTGTGAGAALLAVGGCAGEARPSFRVLFLTDFHTRGDLGVPDALGRLADQVNRIGPDLVIGGGDCIHGGFAGPRDVSLERLALFRDFTRSIRPEARWIIGNHDFARAVDGAGNVLPGDPTRAFREALGIDELTFSFDRGGVHFIALQSVEVVGGERNYRGFIDAAQLDWLRRDLAVVPPGQPVILITHIPLRTTFIQNRQGATAPLPPNLVVENANEVLEALDGHRLVAVLQGHLHTNERVHWNDTVFLMGGAVSGAWWKGPNKGTEEGYGQIDFHDGLITNYRYIDSGWSPADTAG